MKQIAQNNGQDGKSHRDAERKNEHERKKCNKRTTQILDEWLENREEAQPMKQTGTKTHRN